MGALLWEFLASGAGPSAGGHVHPPACGALYGHFYSPFGVALYKLYQVHWRLRGPVSLDTTFWSQPLPSPTTLSLPLTQPGVYTLTIGYFIYEQGSNGCEDSLRYTIYVLQDSTGSGCPTNFPDTLRLTLGSHRLTFPLGYSTALYMWSLQGPSGYQSGSNGNVDTIVVPAVFSSPGWHILQLLFYSPNGYHCQVHIMIYVSPPTVPPCLSPTVRPCKPLVTINNVTLSPNGGPSSVMLGAELCAVRLAIGWLLSWTKLLVGVHALFYGVLCRRAFL
jgi:hypothetical protein